MSQLVNLVIDQGSDFVATLDVQDSIGNALDLAPYNVRGQVRKSYTSSTATDIACTKTDNQGEVKLALTNTQTDNVFSDLIKIRNEFNIFKIHIYIISSYNKRIR